MENLWLLFQASYGHSFVTIVAVFVVLAELSTLPLASADVFLLLRLHELSLQGFELWILARRLLLDQKLCEQLCLLKQEVQAFFA